MIIHTEKLRWLFWLRWKMFARGFTRRPGRISHIIGTIFLVLFGLPLIGGIAVLTYLAYRYLPSPANIESLFLVLTGVYLLWIVLPLLEFNINEGLDLSKLVLFPLSRAELMVSLLFSTFLDIPTIGLLLIFAAVIAGWASSVPLALFAVLAMLIFYIQVVGISQLVLALLMRVLQSRRFRDLSIILLALFSSGGYLFLQVAARGLGANNLIDALFHRVFSPYLQWLPPGMAAQAIEQALAGNWGAALLWLAVLLVIGIIVLYLWQLVVERSLSTPEVGNTQRRMPARVSGSGTGRAARQVAFGSALLAAPVRAMVLKDLKYLRRDPQLQAMFVQSIISMAVLVVITLFNSGGRGGVSRLGDWAVLIAPAYVFFSLYMLSYNVLGFERQSLTTLFLFPVRPEYILFAKNIVVLLIGGVEVIVLVLLAAFVSHAWHMVLPALVVGLAGIGAMLGCGNFTSVFLPQRLRQARRGMTTATNVSAEGGCLRAVMSLASFVAMAVILLPVAAALVLPVIFDARWIWSISVPLTLVYSAAFYYLVTTRVARRMLERIPEILEQTTKE
ncbi:hypothetical protein EPA93_26185 [Ktedonosporobacter rubrisoli]|uniref:Uncharacterized protein n=1 Tax=Ktedonosporobacter rubrisoli TaxID=2509675 RepID=A0A4P6JWA8_KTERU|nr:hypothetical protein [Ktedonosporobacter rubrisoli]QBD79286.1 hypothetical protein EPA93_26185 [Ktedonosporobacter rubrisoli]